MFQVYFTCFSSRNGFCRDDEKRPALALYDQFRPKPGENRPRSVDMRPQRHGDARAKTAFSSTNVENRPRKEELKEPGKPFFLHYDYSGDPKSGQIRISDGPY
jgi:hypothetical protein